MFQNNNLTATVKPQEENVKIEEKTVENSTNEGIGIAQKKRTMNVFENIILGGSEVFFKNLDEFATSSIYKNSSLALKIRFLKYFEDKGNERIKTVNDCLDKAELETKAKSATQAIIDKYGQILKQRYKGSKTKISPEKIAIGLNDYQQQLSEDERLKITSSVMRIVCIKLKLLSEKTEKKDASSEND